jgi:hypothetical protein
VLKSVAEPLSMALFFAPASKVECESQVGLRANASANATAIAELVGGVSGKRDSFKNLRRRGFVCGGQPLKRHLLPCANTSTVQMTTR